MSRCGVTQAGTLFFADVRIWGVAASAAVSVEAAISTANPARPHHALRRDATDAEVEIGMALLSVATGV
jgi:hypothetical protein